MKNQKIYFAGTKIKVNYLIEGINKTHTSILATNFEVSGNAMVTHPANKKLNKTEFNNQEDWEIYPTADYCCDKCNQTVSLNFANLNKHQFSTFSNLNDKDKEAFDLFASTNKLEPTNSFLDFYCPTCKRPVRIYYDSWAGGRHGEQGFSIKYIVD